ncbi:MAG: LysR family transcriptional regulator [Granulosicoccus sp.]
MRDLPLKALRVFESVARCGSFKEAADELCVSQSAVSHQIKHLEQWLGQPLFDRTGHRPQPQAHAQILSSALQRAFYDIDTACQMAQCSPDSQALVIASIPSVAICWLIPRLSDFQSRYPKIPTRLTYAFHGQTIDFNKVDLAFVFANKPPAYAGHRTQLFQAGTSVPVCSPSLYNTLELATLSKSIIEAGLLHDANTDGWTQWLGQSELDAMPPVTGPIFEDFNLLRAAALAGQGIALCPLALIGTDLTSNRLIQLSDISIHHDYNYYLIQRETSNSEPVSTSECFAEWVSDRLRLEADHSDSL